MSKLRGVSPSSGRSRESGDICKLSKEHKSQYADRILMRIQVARGIHAAKLAGRTDSYSAERAKRTWWWWHNFALTIKVSESYRIANL